VRSLCRCLTDCLLLRPPSGVCIISSISEVLILSGQPSFHTVRSSYLCCTEGETVSTPLDKDDHILSYSSGSIFINVYKVLFLFNTVIYVFLLLCLCILIVCLCMTTLTEGFPCFFPQL